MKAPHSGLTDMLYQLLTFYSVVCLVVWNPALALDPKNSSSVGALRCRNPNGHLGICVSLHDCEPLRHLLLQLNDRSYRFVQQSRCAGGSNINRYARQRGDSSVGKPPYVCCSDDTEITEPLQGHGNSFIFPDDERLASTTTTTTEKPTTTTTEKPTTTTAAPAEKLAVLPKAPLCGIFTTISTKIYGGVEAELNEFPWMANLEYRRQANDNLTSSCAGTLINERYILTAAHCVQGPITQIVGQIVSVRLGDHNTATETDCNADDCNGPALRVLLESITVHKDYEADRDLGIHQHHDIALLRLKHAVSFSHAIKPICLPLMETEPELTDGLKLTVAGWGHNGTVTHTNVKHKVRVPYVDLQRCRRLYGKMYIADGQLCAGGVYNQDSCSGDSGGPLMRFDSHAWMLEGVVSFGRRCGLEQPGIYTRVRSYVNWIEQNVKL